jgi:hypothetical protein
MSWTSDSSDVSDNCEDDIAVADAALDEEDSDVEEHSLGDTDYKRDFIWEGMDNYHDSVNYFLVILDFRTQA